jgi:hypothetical protein
MQDRKVRYVDLVGTHPPVTAVSTWARRSRWLRIGRRGAPPEESDAQWAPPYDGDEALYTARTPEPWPPAPPDPPPPRMPEGSAGDDGSARPSSRPDKRRIVAIGAAVALLATWVAVAVFLAPGGSKATGLAQGNGSPTPGSNSYGYGFGSGAGPGAFSRRGTSGVIQSVVGPTITLLDRSGATVTVRTSTDTAYTKTVKASVQQIHAGDTIVASGLYTAANATVTAGRVSILRATGTIPGGGRTFSAAGGNTVVGTVTSIGGDHLTVDLSDGTLLTVILSPSVTMTAPVAGSLRELARGESITVRGQGDGDGALIASQVDEGTSTGFFGAGPGGFTPSGVVQS